MATLIRRSDKGFRRKGILPDAEPVVASVKMDDLEGMVTAWIEDGRSRQHSPRTLETRRFLSGKLSWWLHKEGRRTCGRDELKGFFHYLSAAHTSENGRWDIGDDRSRKPLRPGTVRDYHRHLCTFFTWLVEEAYIEESPMDGIRPPVARAGQIQPFTEQQAFALLDAARTSRYPHRDEAVILFLLDTGVRASELCGILRRDVDLVNRRALVMGKGNKQRAVFLSAITAKAVRLYLKDSPGEKNDPLFVTARHQAFSRSGLQQVIGRLGRRAGIEAVRCSPHTFRNTAAIFFLRNGGNAFALREMLGHTTMAMTNKYVAIAQADVERQHRMYSPVDWLKSGRR